MARRGYWIEGMGYEGGGGFKKKKGGEGVNQ